MGNERNDWSARKFVLNPVVCTPCPHSKSFPPADQRSRFSLMPNSDHVGRSVLGSSRTLSSSPGRGVYIRNDSVVLQWHPFSHFYSEFLPPSLVLLPFSFVPHFYFPQSGSSFDPECFLRQPRWTTGRICSCAFSRSPTSTLFRAPGRVIYFDSICKLCPLETALAVIPKGVGPVSGHN